MDGRDPPEPPPPPRPPPEEEEEEGRRSAAAAAAAAMAKEAAALFQGRRYTECIDVLKQLLLRKEGDPKVRVINSTFLLLSFLCILLRSLLICVISESRGRELVLKRRSMKFGSILRHNGVYM